MVIPLHQQALKKPENDAEAVPKELLDAAVEIYGGRTGDDAVPMNTGNCGL